MAWPSAEVLARPFICVPDTVFRVFPGDHVERSASDDEIRDGSSRKGAYDPALKLCLETLLESPGRHVTQGPRA